MKKYTEFVTEELLTEKLLLINNGKKYGQIVFLAGGAGSGKGFAGMNFLNGSDFKTRDVDSWKSTFLKLSRFEKDISPVLKAGKHKSIKDLLLKNPNDVGMLHNYVDKFNIKDKTMKLLIQNMTAPDRLPNIIFDVTLKNTKYMEKIIPELEAVGYKSQNVHLVWVLTDYGIAVKANRERARVVPDDILLDTHEGAANTMWDIVGGKAVRGLNGGIYVILGNRDATISFKESDGRDYRKADDDSSAKTRKTKSEIDGFDFLNKAKLRPSSKPKSRIVIKDFKYLTYKEPNKTPNTSSKIKIQLLTWITNNVPFTTAIKVFQDQY